MKIGSLRYSVQLQQPTETRGVTGQVLHTWSTVSTVWANIEPGTLSTEKQGLTTKVIANYKLTLRATQLQPTWRIKCGSDVFNITAILPDPRKTFVVVEAVKQYPPEVVITTGEFSDDFSEAFA